MYALACLKIMTKNNATNPKNKNGMINEITAGKNMDKGAMINIEKKAIR